jgi:two-component system, cell cycle sensor histidine kinase and response regulator CckA
VTVVTDVASDLAAWTVIGDPAQFSQVVVNLATNTRVTMHRRGTLTLSCHIDPNDDAAKGIAVIGVRDTGVGIAPEVAAHMFEPFFTTRAFGEGTGLGLATSNAIVANHGGQIRVESSPDNGALFAIELPALPSLELTLTAPIETAPTGGGQLILVVDDEALIRQATRSTLEANGYRVAVAGNGAEAIEYLAAVEGAVDLILTDIRMPTLDGIAMSNRVAELFPQMPVVTMSGLGAEADSHRPHIAKPFTTPELLRVIAAQLLSGADPSSG